MTTEALHPDHLQPGDTVGPWLIIQVLGRGGSSRVFKVERDGHPYSMKMALHPLTQAGEAFPEEAEVEEKSAWRRLAREAAALFTYASHPNLLRVYAVDFWPNPSKGYPFLITDFVDGDNWHQWRWREPLHAAALVDTFREVVRTVGVLHQRGVYHRDLKADNLLIRREDGRPFLIDFGTVRLPGALTRTLGIPEGVLHLLPPELLAYTRTEAWKRGEPFQGGVAADLYALGVLLYQGLTDLHPFNPELPDKELVAAIATLPPVAPHRLNPRAPHSLSDIAMKLMEKRPEGRYPDTEALLQALEKAAEQERTSPAWTVPLFTAEGRALEPPPLEVAVQRAQPAAPQQEQTQAAARQQAPAAAVRPHRARRYLTLLAGLALLGFVSWRAHCTLTPRHGAMSPALTDKGSPPMPTSPQDATPARSRSGFLAAWLCAVAGLGCPAAQVKPPAPATPCPKEATDVMFGEWKVDQDRRPFTGLRAIVDINQPGDGTGVYTEGPVIGRITRGAGGLPEGTLLHGRLWTGPGIYDMDHETGQVYLDAEAVMGHYTLAILPDGRKYPVCIVIGNPDGRVEKLEGSKPGAAVMNRELPVSAVWRWL
jgi:serine/threonine-protein kinase